MADIGTTLREARMRAGLDITEAERATKIRARYLRAMEHEEWDALPGHVYIKSFLRTYGNYLGLDSRMLVEEYKRRYERPSVHESRSVATLRRERERAARGPLLPAWAPIAVVIVAILAALYFIGLHNSKPTTTPAPKPAITQPTHHPAKRTHRTPRRPASPTTVTLGLRATGPVYVCLTDAAGKVLIPGQIFTAGQLVPAKTGKTLLLTLGNNAVHMRVNGRLVNVPASSRAIGYRLTPKGATTLPTSQMPRCA
jgi:cytoskeletal protein RodZ